MQEREPHLLNVGIGEHHTEALPKLAEAMLSLIVVQLMHDLLQDREVDIMLPEDG